MLLLGSKSQSMVVSRESTHSFPTTHIFWVKQACMVGVLVYRNKMDPLYVLWPTWSRGRQQW